MCDYKGYVHHASKDDPQYAIKSDKTEHVALHKACSANAHPPVNPSSVSHVLPFFHRWPFDPLRSRRFVELLRQLSRSGSSSMSAPFRDRDRNPQFNQR